MGTKGGGGFAVASEGVQNDSAKMMLMIFDDSWIENAKAKLAESWWILGQVLHQNGSDCLSCSWSRLTLAHVWSVTSLVNSVWLW